MARILILRTATAAQGTAMAVRARGHEALMLPLETIRPLAPPLPTGPFGGFVLTSANAVRYLAAHFGPPDGAVLAVGAATAEAARSAGFEVAATGEGTGVSLAERALQLGSQAPLLYLAGRVRTAGLEAALTASAVPFETIEVYDIVPLEPAEAEVSAALGDAAPDAVLVLSAGQAKAFEGLAERLPSLFAPRPLALCLSKRIRDAFSGKFGRDAIVADRPELSALLDRYGGALRAQD